VFAVGLVYFLSCDTLAWGEFVLACLAFASFVLATGTFDSEVLAFTSPGLLSLSLAVLACDVLLLRTILSLAVLACGVLLLRETLALLGGVTSLVLATGVLEAMLVPLGLPPLTPVPLVLSPLLPRWPP
jgi:hypothetical protein